MVVYSALLAAGLAVSAPWWLWRMATSGRYRAGLAGRLGKIPQGLPEAVAGKQVIWLHAVSVGEVLGSLRLIALLRQSFTVVVSTTTQTAQTMARQKLTGVPVFYLPLDFAYAVRRYLRVLRPRLVVLMESELWPRLLVECEQTGVPVAVVNARISDRSYPRYLRLRRLWRPLLAKVARFLAQGEESAARLRTLGVADDKIRLTGNLKFDAPEPVAGPIVERIRRMAGRHRVVVAGSTLAGEEALILEAWHVVRAQVAETVLVLAPRHPERFREVQENLSKTGLHVEIASSSEDASEAVRGGLADGAVILLDTVGDLAAIYSLAAAAFVGGSLVPKGGHNPLEAARFGVPVAMGNSYENFREIVEAMRVKDAISIVAPGQLGPELVRLLQDGKASGERGRLFYEAHAGATERTVLLLLELIS